jgi:hypothetical protein
VAGADLAEAPGLRSLRRRAAPSWSWVVSRPVTGAESQPALKVSFNGPDQDLSRPGRRASRSVFSRQLGQCVCVYYLHTIIGN